MKKFLGVIIILLAAILCVWLGELRSVLSVKQVGDNKYLYEMNYTASYDLDEVISRDIDSSEGLLNYVTGKITKGIPVSLSKTKDSGSGEHCTSFQAAKDDGSGFWFGRNYDFFKNPTLVTYSRPKKGYASIACSDMSHFGYSLEKLPTDFKSKLLCLAAIYAPVDGINEKGLCISIMALPKQPAYQNTGKHKISTSILIRLVLDRCASVDEALELLSNYDVCHDQKVGSGYHYLIADAAGNCAALEFDLEDGWKSMVTRKAEGCDYMLITNHLLNPKYYTETPNPKYGNPHSKSWWRYQTAHSFLSGHSGRLTFDEAQQCLSDVHWKDLVWDNGMVEDTQYSNVYDQTNLTLSLRSWAAYDKTEHFSLKK